MKILELLKDEKYNALIQGDHTRLLISGLLYEVFRRNKGEFSRYNNKLSYQGYDEEDAVRSFIESESA